VQITRPFPRLKTLGMMRHKVLILFLLLGFVQLLPVAQVVNHRSIPKFANDSILSGDSDKRHIQLQKLFQLVPEDSAAQKAVLLNPQFREKYLNDQEFNYHQEEGGKPFFKRLFEKIGRILHDLFGVTTLNKYGDLTAFVFKILCGLVFLVAVYLIIRLLMNHQGKWFFRKSDESIPIDINNTEQLIQSADFEQLISEMEMLGDTRQSIRLYYLWLLKDLKNHELIVWLPEKTNADYLRELKGELLREKFSTLSYLFNYIWYGGFEIGDDDYISAKKAFLKYLKGDHQDG